MVSPSRTCAVPTRALAGRRHVAGQECQGEDRCVSHDALNGELLAMAGRTVPVRRRSAIEMTRGGSPVQGLEALYAPENRPSVDVAFRKTLRPSGAAASGLIFVVNLRTAV